MPINTDVFRTRERKQTHFENMEPQYFLNNKGQLEESPIMKDCQAIIDSSEYTSLDAMYDKMLEINAQMYQTFNGGELVQEREYYETDLDVLLQFDSIKDRYASEDNSVQNMTHAQMVEHIKNKLTNANANIDKFKNKEFIDNNGGNDDEKANFETQK